MRPERRACELSDGRRRVAHRKLLGRGIFRPGGVVIEELVREVLERLDGFEVDSAGESGDRVELELEDSLKGASTDLVSRPVGRFQEGLEEVAVAPYGVEEHCREFVVPVGDERSPQSMIAVMPSPLTNT